MNPQNLIATLKTQHRGLQSNLSLALQNAEPGLEHAGEKIFTELTKFKDDLSEHMRLEGVEFYPDYIAKLAKQGNDTVRVKEFIKQMDTIAEVIMAFLHTYDTPAAIDKDLSQFRNDLSGIISTLNIRIETEEDGLFDLYTAM